jgi:hypothetical protein
MVEQGLRKTSIVSQLGDHQKNGDSDGLRGSLGYGDAADDAARGRGLHQNPGQVVHCSSAIA